MEVSSTYTLLTSAWLALQSVPLLFTPSVLLPLLNTAEASARATTLEIYLSRSLALSQLALASLSLLLSGLIPLSSLAPPSTSSAESPEVANAYLLPVTLITTLHHFATAFHAYTSYTSSGQTTFALGLLGSGVLAAAGTWCTLFAGDKGHISRRTGKDKRVSGWPFGDKKGRLSATGKDL